jgi:hypothetical protein
MPSQKFPAIEAGDWIYPKGFLLLKIQFQPSGLFLKEK